MDITASNSITCFALIAAVNLSKVLNKQLDLVRTARKKGHAVDISVGIDLYGMFGAFFFCIFAALVYYGIQDALSHSIFYRLDKPVFESTPYTFSRIYRKMTPEMKASLKGKYTQFLSNENNLLLHHFSGYNPIDNEFISALGQEKAVYFQILRSFKEGLVFYFLSYIVSVSRKPLNSTFFISALQISIFILCEVLVISSQSRFITIDLYFPTFHELNLRYLTAYGKIKVFKQIGLTLCLVLNIFYAESTYEDPNNFVKFFLNIAQEQLEDINNMFKYL